MQRQEIGVASAGQSFPTGVPRWSGLRAQMTVTCMLVVLALLAATLTVRLTIFVLLNEPSQHLTPSKYIVTIVPIYAVIIGVLTGLAAARRPVRRIKRLVAATTAFAQGDAAERVQVTRVDELGQLEHHFNQMAEQLAESIDQQRFLAEQNARLAERSRISRDLHDSVKQHLFAVALQVGVALSQVDAADERIRAHLLEADTLVSLAQQDLTAIIQQLRPSALQHKKLPSALRDYAKDWSRQHGLAIELRVEDTVTVPHAIEEAFWHVAVEALSNVARHSHATDVWIDLEATPDERVTLLIADNGRGVPVDANGREGFGLQSMRERLEAVGGTTTIESSPTGGTRVIAQSPACLMVHRQSDSAGVMEDPTDAAKEVTP